MSRRALPTRRLIPYLIGRCAAHDVGQRWLQLASLHKTRARSHEKTSRCGLPLSPATDRGAGRPCVPPSASPQSTATAHPCSLSPRRWSDRLMCMSRAYGLRSTAAKRGDEAIHVDETSVTYRRPFDEYDSSEHRVPGGSSAGPVAGGNGCSAPCRWSSLACQETCVGRIWRYHEQ